MGNDSSTSAEAYNGGNKEKYGMKTNRVAKAKKHHSKINLIAKIV